jgi:hypothetical protein
MHHSSIAGQVKIAFAYMSYTRPKHGAAKLASSFAMHVLPNQRLKLSARGGRLIGNGSVLSAAAAGRSLSAIR